MSCLIESTVNPLQVQDSKTLRGVFAIADTFNQNKRKYPKAIYDQAYERILPKIKERKLLGELDHPADRDEVYLSNVSHVVTELHKGLNNEGKTVYSGTVELLDTPSGRIAQALIKAGIPLGISSRGVGNTRKIPEGVEVTEFNLITYDMVAEPSFKVAFLSESKKSELSESLNFIESKIPLNESKEYESIRTNINNIRESLRLTESGVNHIENERVQTLELDVLRSLLESKSRTILSDTKLLKEQKKLRESDSKRISELEEDLKKMNSRYTSIRENHHKLQEAYNNLKESCEEDSKKRISEKDEQIIDLQKRLAVEKRGMSYQKVQVLLEGLSTPEEIESRLDTVTTMRRRSSTLTENYAASLKEQLTINGQQGLSPLSKIVSRV